MRSPSRSSRPLPRPASGPLTTPATHSASSCCLAKPQCGSAGYFVSTHTVGNTGNPPIFLTVSRRIHTFASPQSPFGIVWVPPESLTTTTFPAPLTLPRHEFGSKSPGRCRKTQKHSIGSNRFSENAHPQKNFLLRICRKTMHLASHKSNFLDILCTNRIGPRTYVYIWRHLATAIPTTNRLSY